MGGVRGVISTLEWKGVGGVERCDTVGVTDG